MSRRCCFVPYLQLGVIAGKGKNLIQRAKEFLGLLGSDPGVLLGGASWGMGVLGWAILRMGILGKGTWGTGQQERRRD